MNSDSVPLVEDQRVALMALFSGLECNDDPTFCPNISAGRPCPRLAPNEFSPRLRCEDGFVTEIGLYFSSMRFNDYRAALQRQVGDAFVSPAISRLSRLERFYLFRFRRITGTLDVFAKNTALRHLNIGEANWHGTLDALSSLTNLIELAVGSTNVSGTVPLALSKLPLLFDVRLTLNRLSGTAPAFDGYLMRPAGQFRRCELMADQDTNCFSSCVTAECCKSTRVECMLAPTAAPTPLSTAPMSSSVSLSTAPFVTGSSSSSVGAVGNSSVGAVGTMPTTAASAALPASAVAGIVVGVVLAVLLLVLGALLWSRRQNRRRQTRADDADVGAKTTPSSEEYGSVFGKLK